MLLIADAYVMAYLSIRQYYPMRDWISLSNNVEPSWTTGLHLLWTFPLHAAGRISRSPTKHNSILPLNLSVVRDLEIDPQFNSVTRVHRACARVHMPSHSRETHRPIRVSLPSPALLAGARAAERSQHLFQQVQISAGEVPAFNS